ncbi:RDD family protein [Streptomyces sp. HUAS TT20]|uniref:RDD family protein n=1 Tax=Streptomyces sp. HUAS TT20 TaxID=3447509 RepID=UPI0021DAA238|nr:RDD family protein [Streptomyces sp. HUAS 15-9]UXY27851.1 RDD family protein [Streptomyces sp. HUAS 15-9]
MSTEPPPGSGQQPPEEDPFRKQPPPGQGAGSPYDTPAGEGEGQGPPGPGPGPGSGSPYDTPSGQGPPGPGSPYDVPPGGQPPPPYGGGPYGSGGAPADPLAGMPPLADSGKRTLARIIDMVLVGIVVWLVTLVFRVNELQMSSDRIEVGKGFAQSIIVAVLYVAYDTLLIAKTGQTLGKKWLGMRVADLEDGSTPSTQTSLTRALVLWIPFAFCCACIWTAIAGGWSFFDKPYKQGLHDKAAKTVVVSTG